MVYSRNIDDQVLSFGVSGRLYKSNVLLYDHQTESLWSQMHSRSITGKMVGKQLEILPAYRTSWKTWKEKHPKTVVLSTDTGYSRDYTLDPYTGYYRMGTIMFPVGKVRTDLSPKAHVIGIEIDGESRAYPIKTLGTKPGRVEDKIGDKTIRIDINAKGEIIRVSDEAGKPVPHLFAYWFAWQAFHPETEVFK